MKVLIADDDPISRLLVRKSLESWGYQVLVANDGIEAKKVLDLHDDLQLFVIDWSMPNLNGLEFCRDLKSNYDMFSYIIMLTSRRGTSNVVEAMSSGVDDFVSKPFVSEELRVRLKVGKRIVEQERRLSFFANNDPLTGVWNRRLIMNFLKAEFDRSEREEKSLSLCIFDLDNFKQVNDRYGHLGGDECLIHFSNTVMQQTRNYDYFGRFGGEEFVLILPETDTHQAFDIANRIRECISSSSVKLKDGASIDISTSIGVTERLAKNDSGEAMFKRCDEALYQAKSFGKNCVKVL